MNGDREKALEYWQQAEKLSKEPPQEGSEERSEKELNLLRKKIVHNVCSYDPSLKLRPEIFQHVPLQYPKMER